MPFFPIHSLKHSSHRETKGEKKEEFTGSWREGRFANPITFSLGEIGRKRNKRDWTANRDPSSWRSEKKLECVCGGWTRQKLGNLVEKPGGRKSGISERLKFIGLSCATGQILVSLHRSMLVIINHVDDEQTYRSITCLPGPSGYWVIDFPEPGHPCQG